MGEFRRDFIQNMNDIEIYGIETSMLDRAWDEIKPFIELGLEHAQDELTAIDVYNLIKQHVVVPIVMGYEGEILAVVTLELSEKPNKRIMSLMTAGGTSIDKWLDEFLEIATQLAVEQNCDAIYITGRRGWEKKLKRYGYNYAYTVLTKELKCH